MMMRTALIFAIVTSIRSCFGLMEDLNLAPDFDHTPFLHGVASADPLYDRVLIWTRISPSLTLTSDTVTVSWAVWEKDDPSQSFDRPLRWNVTRTTANDDFTVTIDVMGLQQGIRYNYQFQDESGRRSIVGTTKTLSTDDVDTVRVAFLSCTSLWSGYFNFYRHLASDSDVDLVLHQGDFIYPDIAEPEMHRVPENLCKEWEWFSKVPSLHRRRLNRRALREEEADPVHFLNGFIDSVNCSSASILERYRFIYSLYMLDPDLRAARAQHPFVISLDNHDQYSYMSGRIPMDGSRKAAREWVPQRTQIVKPSRGQPFEAALRHFRMGKNLLDIILLDTYGYSGDADMKKEDGILGDGQHEWLEAVLHDSSQSSVSWRLFGSGKTFMPFVLNHLGRGFVLPLALVFLFLLGMTLLCIVVEMSSSDVAYLELPQKQTTGTEDTEGFLEPSTRRVMYVGWMTYVKETHAEALRWCTAWSITSLLMWTVICVSILLFARHKLNDSSHLKTLNPGIDEWEGQMGSMDRLFDQLEATGTDSNNFWAVGDMHYSYAADVFRFDATAKESVLKYTPSKPGVKRYGVEMLPASGTRGNCDEKLGELVPLLKPGSVLSSIADLVTNHVIKTMNPHYRYFDGQSHGYGKLTVTSTHMEAAFLQFPILRKTDEMRVGASLYVTSGENRWSVHRPVLETGGGSN